jgi:hypothetical protein
MTRVKLFPVLHTYRSGVLRQRVKYAALCYPALSALIRMLRSRTYDPSSMMECVVISTTK